MPPTAVPCGPWRPRQACRPSGDHATQLTAAACPRNLRMTRPLQMSQRWTLLPLEAEARVTWSGEHATPVTVKLPVNQRTACPLDASTAGPCGRRKPRLAYVRWATTPHRRCDRRARTAYDEARSREAQIGFDVLAAVGLLLRSHGLALRRSNSLLAGSQCVVCPEVHHR